MSYDSLVSDRTNIQIINYLKRPGHALLICGQPGSGKSDLALDIAAKLLGVPTDRIPTHPFFIKVQKPEGKQDIPIDEIRGVIKKLQLKATGNDAKAKRLILIESAQLLNRESQNALLKAIEEPPAETAFILTATSSEELLPTISSRAQKITVAPVTLQAALDHYSVRFSAEEITSAWQLSGGAAGLLDALLNQKDGHELKKAVDLAKKFLRMNRYNRVIYLDRLAADKNDLLLFFDSLGRIYASLQASAVSSGYLVRAAKLLACRRMIIEATESITQNASVKMACLDLALRLPL